MKKILSLIGSFGLIATTATTVVSCVKDSVIAEFTFLDYKMADSYSGREIYNEKQDLEIVKNNVTKIESNLNDTLEKLKQNPSDKNLIKMYNEISQAINQFYRYAIKTLSYEIILLEKDWWDVVEEDGDIYYYELDETDWSEIVTLLKEGYTDINKAIVDLKRSVFSIRSYLNIDSNLEEKIEELGKYINDLPLNKPIVSL